MTDEQITVPRALFERLLDAFKKANSGRYTLIGLPELVAEAGAELAKCPPCHGAGNYMYTRDCLRCGGTGKLKEKP